MLEFFIGVVATILFMAFFVVIGMGFHKIFDQSREQLVDHLFAGFGVVCVISIIIFILFIIGTTFIGIGGIILSLF